MKKLLQLFAFTFLIYGAILFIGFITDAKSILHPLNKFTSAKSVQGFRAIPSIEADNIKGYSLAKLQEKVKSSMKPVVVDFRKKSCSSCDELEEFTLSNPAVKEELKRFTFIKIDVTAQTDSEKELMKHYMLFGTPSVIFFDKAHKALPSQTIAGFVKADKFLKRLKTIN